MRHSLLIKFATVIIILFAVNQSFAGVSEIFRLAETDTPEQLKQAVSNGVNFNFELKPNFDADDPYIGYDDEYDYEFMTPLHAAAARNHNPESIKYLLSLSAST